MKKVEITEQQSGQMSSGELFTLGAVRAFVNPILSELEHRMVDCVMEDWEEGFNGGLSQAMRVIESHFNKHLPQTEDN